MEMVKHLFKIDLIVCFSSRINTKSSVFTFVFKCDIQLNKYMFITINLQ